MGRSRSPEDVLSAFAGSDAEKVKVAVCDIDGILRGKFLHRDKFLSATESGFGFCDVVFGWDCEDVCYDNTTYTGWHTGYPDALARVDLLTHRRIPWEDDGDLFLCDFEDAKGDPLPVCPRQALKGVVSRLREAGFDARVGFEFEWFNFRETPQSLAQKNYAGVEPLTPGMFGYSLLRAGQNHPYLNALMKQLKGFGVPLEGLHTETGPGTFEAAIVCANALEAADRAVLFKFGVKQISYLHGIVASFMARWNTALPGCGGHVHYSLGEAGTETNLFHDENAPEQMTPVFRHFLAGQLACLPEFLPFYAPTVNSYKRLVEGYWAPTTVDWGFDNRTVGFRVIPGSAKGARAECRVPGADINPYVTLAALLASGLYGIENKLELTQAPVVGNAYRAGAGERLSTNLKEATEKLASSSLARDLLGAPFVEHFVNTRFWEWRRFEQATTDWELKRYFELA